MNGFPNWARDVPVFADAWHRLIDIANNQEDNQFVGHGWFAAQFAIIGAGLFHDRFSASV